MRRQQRQQDEGLIPNAETLTLSPTRIKCHHPKCPKHFSTSQPDQMITVHTTNNNASVNTSPENSEAPVEQSKNSARANGTVLDGGKDQKNIRLRLASSVGVVETEQLLVKLNHIISFFSI